MTTGFEADTVSSLVKRATDVLFLQNPVATSLGLLVGIACNGLSIPISKALGVDFSSVNVVVWIAAGIVLCNLPSLFRGHRLDPQIEAALAAIRKARNEGEISRIQARTMYIALYQKVLSQVTLNREAAEFVRRGTRKTDVA